MSRHLVTLQMTCTDHNGFVLMSRRITRPSLGEVGQDEVILMKEMVRRHPNEYIFHDRINNDTKNEETPALAEPAGYREPEQVLPVRAVDIAGGPPPSGNQLKKKKKTWHPPAPRRK